MFRKGGKSTSMNTGGRRRVATEFEDGGEMIEEYDLKTDELLLRKRRGRTVLGKDEASATRKPSTPRTSMYARTHVRWRWLIETETEI